MADLPKTYRLTGWSLIFVIAVLVAFAGGSVWVAYAAWRINPENALQIGAAVVFGALGLGAGVLIWMAVRGFAVLHADRIEADNGFGARAMRAHDIAGYRRSFSRDQLRLVSNVPGVKSISVPRDILKDGDALPWIKALVDRDALDRAAEREALLQDPRLGGSVSERAGVVAQTKIDVRRLNRVAYGVAVWGFILPIPYTLAVLAVATMPLLLLVVVYAMRPIVRFNARVVSGDDWPRVDGALVACSLVLALRAMIDVTLLEYGPAILVATLATFASLPLFIMLDPTLARRYWALAGMAMVAFFYSSGFGIEANKVLDGSTAYEYEARIAEMHVDRGRRSTQYELIVSPWGPRREVNTVTVSRSLYEAVKEGQIVCVVLHRGAFGWAWYEVDRC